MLGAKARTSNFKAIAVHRLRERDTAKHKRIYIPSMDKTITIRSLNRDEMLQCMEYVDGYEADRYGVYLAVVRPNLRALADELIVEGEIKTPIEVSEMFTHAEVARIMQEVCVLSGFFEV